MTPESFTLLHPYRVFERRGVFHSRYSTIEGAARTVDYLGRHAFVMNGALRTDFTECSRITFAADHARALSEAAVSADLDENVEAAGSTDADGVVGSEWRRTAGGRSR
jgi:hypothetical protein